MKRISLTLTLFAVGLLGTMAMATASASAQGGVLCKKAPTNNYCGYENFYPEGTEIKAQLASGTKAQLSWPGSPGAMGSCAQSNLEFGLAKVGGLNQPSWIGTNEFSFGTCDHKRTMITIGNPEGAISWKEGTHNGTVLWANFEIENPAAIVGGRCSYVITGAAELIGGTSPQLVFNNTATEWSSGVSYLCPKSGVTFSATYNISTPTPLYVEKY